MLALSYSFSLLAELIAENFSFSEKLWDLISVYAIFATLV
jgi:hypothetical protein